MVSIIYELRRRNISHVVCVTAQHREMLDQVLNFFEIVPDYDLNLMGPNQSLNSFSSKILEQLDNLLNDVKPEMVLVQGDTNTAFMSALAAFNLKIKIGHIEAGLRTYNKSAPFPEEGYRQLISRIANVHFAPTEAAEVNLMNEGISINYIKTTGNTVIDALEIGKEKLKSGFDDQDLIMLKKLILPGKKVILVTGHRRENIGTGIEELCDALLKLVSSKDVQVIFPVHLNPQVAESVNRKLRGMENIFLVAPLSYPAMIWLMNRCDLVISDSGGIQEEAPSFKKPLLVTREVSERKEGIEAGFSVLTGMDKNKILNKALYFLENPPDFSGIGNPYGDGQAAKHIIEFLNTLD